MKALVALKAMAIWKMTTLDHSPNLTSNETKALPKRRKNTYIYGETKSEALSSLQVEVMTVV